MKINNMKTILKITFFLLSLSAGAQEGKSIFDVLKKLPTIEYGRLPYWNGLIEDYSSFEHGYYGGDSINNVIYNNYMLKALQNDSLGCYFLNDKQTACKCESQLVLTLTNGCVSDGFYMAKGGENINRPFCPCTFAVAKSIIYDKYYVVYFWKAYFTETILYYSLIFDFKGNLLSQQVLDYWNAGFPYFPFNSPDNKIRHVDHEKTTAAYLPNRLLLIKWPINLPGGGNYSVVRLDENGHYRICKEWNEVGEIDEEKTAKDKYKNFIRYDAEGKETMSLIAFSVQDADGFSNIREKADAGSKQLRTIQNNDVVFGTLTQNGWCKINFTADAKGNIEEGGYIHLSRLIKLSDSGNEFIELPKREEWKKNIGVK
jgi:hypothetical protein